MAQYQKRLARVLNTQVADFNHQTQLTFPLRKQLDQPTAELRIDLAQFYALEDCPIQSLVAQRNTTLGKIQSPSQRYLYEIDFIQTLQTCQPLPEEVRHWLQVKQQKLPTAWARVLMLSDELKHQFSAQAGFIRGTDKDGLNQTSQALSYLLQLRQQGEANSTHLEQQLQTLANYPLLSQMWRTQQLLARNLQATSRWLTEQNPGQTCVTGQKPPQQIEFLSNVFRLFFIQKIQPVATRLNYYHYQLQPKLQQLLQNKELQPEFKAFIQEHSQRSFARYQQQMRQHVKLWQQLFKQCQLPFTSS